MMDDNVQFDEESVFNILIATDLHLGYGESNPIRENDTFRTFEEILQIAVKEKVDFILLGGDLFHESRPSPYCINKCTELIRRYCFGDRPVEIEFVSDPSYNFQHSLNPVVNYEDPNLNISIPIFSIHGNHDDPTGKKQISALDLMSTMGLVNYFGRWNNLEYVEVTPVLLKKGETLLALYGLSHIRDVRLARLFIDKKVKMNTPEDTDDYFNLLVLHQNRANRGIKNFISESFIPGFVDLVMWGHEHDCCIDPILSTDGKAFITQPGSPVATSLSEGESIPKKVGILRVYKKNFDITTIPLKTVRPFVFDQISIDSPDKVGDKAPPSEAAQKLVAEKIEEMIRKAQSLGRLESLLPLIRLQVKHFDERQVFNAIRFGQKFFQRVANPEDMIRFISIRKNPCANKPGPSRRGGNTSDDEEDTAAVARAEDLVDLYFADPNNQQANKLLILSASGLSAAVKKYLNANDDEAFEVLADYQAKKTLEKIKEMNPGEDELEECFERLWAARGGGAEDFNAVLNDPLRRLTQRSNVSAVISLDSDDESPSTAGAKKGPGSRGGRVPRGRGRGRGRGKN